MAGEDQKAEEEAKNADFVLIDQFLSGEEEAFSVLVERYQKGIYFMALRMVRTHEEADDLAQQTFLNAFRAMKEFKRQSSFKTWLYQIMMNLSRNHIRDRARHPVVDEAIEALPIKDAAPSQIDLLLDQERSGRLNTAMAALPEQQRLTLMLRAFGEQSYDNIAKVLGCLPGTARTNYHHAIIGMKKMLAEEERG